MRMLGIDYGDKKIGLAFGESQARLAVPLEMIPNPGMESLLQTILQRVVSEQIERVVVGVPLAQGGHHGPEQLNKTRAFIAGLRQVLAIPVEEEDESYTTAESLRLQREEGVHASDDALAAMLILQSYFERHTED